jgi:hypothetical protein
MRISNNLQGFKDAESAKKAKAPTKKIKEEEIVEVVPLVIIPPGQPSSGAAPHLPRDVLVGIAEGFLQI